MLRHLRHFRRTTILASVFSTIFLSAANPTLAHAQAPTRVKLATLAPKGTSYHQFLQAMGEKWRQSGVALTIYTDGTMGSEADMVRRMRVGQIQAAMITAAGLAEIEPSVIALQKMPLMYASLEEAEYVREKLRPDLERRLQEKGFVVLFWGDAGWVRLFSRQPALHPDDFKRMKIFAGAGDNTQLDVMKALGYQPVSLEWSDALMSLQTGLIDALPTTPFHALAGQFYVVTRHMLELNYVPLVGAVVVTTKTWESFPPATRDALQEAGLEAGEQIKARGRAENIESVEAMKKRGLAVHPVPPEVEAEWRRFAEAVYPSMRGKIVPADIFDQVQHLVQEYRAHRKASR